jgi:hypothetical protein
MKVSSKLKRCLYSAYYPCAALESVCKNVRYKPKKGLVPRGFTGAFGKITDVKLIICLAEPGEPKNGESYNTGLSPSALIDDVANRVANAYRWSATHKGRISFHRNVCCVLNYCWPSLSFDEQLKRTWITESTLCSAAHTTGSIPKAIEIECAQRHLQHQIRLFPNAFIIALGKKAERRLLMCNVTPDVSARAAGKPLGSIKEANRSWKNAGRKFQKFILAKSASMRLRKCEP